MYAANSMLTWSSPSASPFSHFQERYFNINTCLSQGGHGRHLHHVACVRLGCVYPPQTGWRYQPKSKPRVHKLLCVNTARRHRRGGDRRGARAATGERRDHRPWSVVTPRGTTAVWPYSIGRMPQTACVMRVPCHGASHAAPRRVRQYGK
jgi:hypothetical protein